MNAVDKIDAWVNKHMTLMLRVGVLASALFLGIYVPATSVYHLSTQLKQERATHAQFANNANQTIEDLSKQVESFNKRYHKEMAAESEVTCLAENIYYETGAKDEEGARAVAQVTLNRKRMHFANSICGVVKQKSGNTCQFSWVCQSHDPPKANVFVHAVEIARKSLTKGVADSTMNTALYFHADYVTPRWAESKNYITQIGHHIFYSERTSDN
jgi:spore germination cell wall hydrolase CwlJ-like protein